MKNCILCGEPTRFDSNDFCEKCFNSSIQELEENYEKRRASRIGKDQPEARAKRTFPNLQG